MKNTSNLFAIDFDALVNAIQEANAPLAKRCQDLIDAGDRFPSDLSNDDQVGRAHKFARLLDMQIKECSKARLNDTKPFKDVTKKIESFFRTFEDRLKSVQGRVLDALSRVALRARADNQRSTVTYSDVDADAESAESPSTKTTIVNTQTGQVYASVLPSERTADVIPTVWKIDSISRLDIDLEALRPYLTTHALLQAANKHLSVHGPHSLRGAAYSLRARI
jgi:hypothetical protein